ncbi:lipopolysaccharide biosynthesis protein [Robertkochia marina]|uniref:lipopolysaccharide biosynthesis protein n=1 Tax=Robertkochia marina TaxID=1227945 RepID=UPI001454C2FF|nr:lipopolysaccharide biosynthesis protein [Robertkochia marina]
MSLTDQIKRSGFWQALEVLVLVITQFVYFGVMARILEKSDYGLMAIANGFVALGMIFAEGGMGAALIQKQNALKSHSKAALQGSILFSLCIVGLFYLMAPLIAAAFDQPMLAELVRVIAWNFVLLAIYSIPLSLLQKEMRFRHSAIVTILASVIAYSFGIVLGYKGWGVWSLVGAVLLNSLLKMIGYLYLAPVRFSIKWYYSEWKELFSFGSGMILLKVNSYISKNGLILLLGKIFSPGMLGVFERSYQINNMPSNYLGQILIKIMFPALSKLQDNEQRQFRLYDHGLGLSNSILMPLSLFLIYFSKEVVLIMLGEKWMDAVLPLQLLFVVMPFTISSRMTDALIRAKGLVYKNVSRKMIYAIILLVSCGFGGYYYGLGGAAVAVVFSTLINYIMMVYLVKVVFKRSFYQVFYGPLKQGVLLTLKTGILLLGYHFSYGMYNAPGVVPFLLFTTLSGIGVLIAGLRFPQFLGSYIKLTLDQVLGKYGFYKGSV